MSLRGDNYETAEEVRFRLEDTVVLYDNRPVYITRVAGGEDNVVEGKKEIARVFIRKLPIEAKDKETRKFLSSRKFDLTPFKMGYMNYKKSAVFVSRRPIRQNRQGLSSGNVSYTLWDGNRAEIDFIDLIGSEDFVKMIDGVYPDFNEAREMLESGEFNSVAVSRSFAFVNDHDVDARFIIHKGTKCGIAMPDDKAVRIARKYHFLKEELANHGIPFI